MECSLEGVFSVRTIMVWSLGYSNFILFSVKSEEEIKVAPCLIDQLSTYTLQKNILKNDPISEIN